MKGKEAKRHLFCLAPASLSDKQSAASGSIPDASRHHRAGVRNKCCTIHGATTHCASKPPASRKAQMEMMGLLVIVILVSLILFFGLSFTINKSKQEAPKKQEFKDVQAVSNMGTTMLESTGPCGRSIRDLLTDCAFTKEVTCEGNDSCAAANTTVKNILAQTLDEWGYEYNMTVSDAQGRKALELSTGCNGTVSNSQTEITPFGTTYGTMQLTITTCR